MTDNLISLLFETGAVKVCEKDRPFWYTSGTIGPFYINTHFTYGSEEKANELLEMINEAIKDKPSCHDKIAAAVSANYESDAIFRKLIDSMLEFIDSEPLLSEFDVISGGERRDWYFSVITAKLLNKPHMTIFKDLDAYITNVDGSTCCADDLTGMKILHISDLVNEASSYLKSWIPAVRNRGGILNYTITIVDRDQGGSELLSRNGLTLIPMMTVNPEMFQRAYENGLIDDHQLQMVKAYIADPKQSMKDFLMNHGGFLSESLAGDQKTAARARLCIDNDIYGLKR